MTSRLYRGEAITLRIYELDGADRIIVILTHYHGQARAVAKGVRRTTSRFGARLELFFMASVQLHARRTFDAVIQTEIIDPFGWVVSADYATFTYISTTMETAKCLSVSDGDLGTETSPQQCLLLAGALTAMPHRRHAPGLILSSYLLRTLALDGRAPSRYDYTLCSIPGLHRALHIQVGGAVCKSCRSAGTVEVEPATMVFLGALPFDGWAVAGTPGQRERSQVSEFVSAYTTWHLEWYLRFLTLMERT